MNGGVLAPVCPYALISLILCSIMIECRDLALNHLLSLTVGGSWDSFEPNGTGLTSQITPTLLGRAHIGVRGHPLSVKIVINGYKNISVNMEKDSAHSLRSAVDPGWALSPLPYPLPRRTLHSWFVGTRVGLEPLPGIPSRTRVLFHNALKHLEFKNFTLSLEGEKLAILLSLTFIQVSSYGISR